MMTSASYMPLPWDVFRELGRQIWMGFAVTFGRRAARPEREENVNNDTLQMRLVLINAGRETEPLTRELPRTAFEPGALAVRIADAIAAGVALGGRQGRQPARSQADAT